MDVPMGVLEATQRYIHEPHSPVTRVSGRRPRAEIFTFAGFLWPVSKEGVGDQEVFSFLPGTRLTMEPSRKH